MGRKKLSMSEKIRRYMTAHPNAKPRDVAAALECAVSLVYANKYKHMKAPSPTLKEVNIDAAHKIAALAAEHKKAVVQAEEAKLDVVNHPPHYTQGGIETIDFLQAKLTKEEFIGYLKGNALKYASRMGKKGDPNIDAGKMAWYAMKLRDVLSTTA